MIVLKSFYCLQYIGRALYFQRSIYFSRLLLLDIMSNNVTKLISSWLVQSSQIDTALDLVITKPPPSTHRSIDPQESKDTA